MSEKRDMPVDGAKTKDAASSLFEIGAGAHREKDLEMAKILLGVAEKLWEEADDSRNAEKARDLYHSV